MSSSPTASILIEVGSPMLRKASGRVPRMGFGAVIAVHVDHDVAFVDHVRAHVLIAHDQLLDCRPEDARDFRQAGEVPEHLRP